MNCSLSKDLRDYRAGSTELSSTGIGENWDREGAELPLPSPSLNLH